MKLTVLVDNNTYIDQYYLGEPALSYYIEEGDARVLFDAGYSGIFVENAEKLGINLAALTHIVLSHGHDDHTKGLPALLEKYDMRACALIAHPDCFPPKRMGTLDFGCPYREDEIAARTDYHPAQAPVWLTERLFYLGEVPRVNDFEPPYAIGEVFRDGQWKPDFVPEDSALVYKSDDGIFVVCGCSHSGVCNIITQAQKVAGEERVLGVIGGFHLLVDDARLAATVDFLADLHMPRAWPCHCVSLVGKARMMARFPVEEVGVGLKLEI